MPHLGTALQEDHTTEGPHRKWDQEPAQFVVNGVIVYHIIVDITMCPTRDYEFDGSGYE